MNRIKLTTEDIFTKDGTRAKVLTSGIDLTARFNENPVMLLEHNPEKIIGKWISVETMNDEITAIPDFDEDEASATIAQKYVKGSIKSASIGIGIDEAYMDGDLLVISKSTLMEASMVGIPANVAAKKMELAKEDMVFLSGGEQVNLSTYINKLKDNMKPTKEKEVEVEEVAGVDVVDQVEVKETEVKEVNEEVIEEVKEEIAEEVKEEKVEEEIVPTEEDTKRLEEVLASKVELSLQLKSSDSKIAELTASKESLTLSIATKDKAIADLEATVASLTNEKREVLLSGAVKDGKITNEGKVDFEDLPYHKIESILNKLVPSEMSLSQTLSTKRAIKKDIKDYAWYLANDRGALSKMSKEDPTLLKQLEAGYRAK